MSGLRTKSSAVWLLVLPACTGLLGRMLGQIWMALAIGAIAALLTAVVLLMHGENGMSSSLAGPADKDLPKERILSRARRLAHEMRALRDAAGALPDAVVVLDQNDRVRWFNHAAEHLLGLRHPHDRDVRLTDRIASPEVTAWLRAGSTAPLNEIPAPADPRCFLSLAMIPLAGGRRLLLARDISTLMRLEQVRRDFVANVSHELRTPLTVIHGYLELVEPEDAPTLAPVLGEMRAQSQRMGQIVEDLLALSRLEVQERLTDEHVAMSLLLATLRKEAEALSQGRHAIVVRKESERDLLGSPKELHSALSNLVSNAVRYTPAEGRIEILWRDEPNGGARFAVTDTGYGIPASHLPRLTERFYRVSSSRSRETGGTGLGLSIVKHVLALHQARLEVQSEPGKGSTFACVFGPERVLDSDAADGNGHARQ
jgi:two-component system phosphate regulon sensor histidine kinase PhoR